MLDKEPLHLTEFILLAPYVADLLSIVQKSVDTSVKYALTIRASLEDVEWWVNKLERESSNKIKFYSSCDHRVFKVKKADRGFADYVVCYLIVE